MEGFTIIDGVVALVIVLSALLAYSRGFVREAMAIVGWIAAAVVAFIFSPKIEPLIKEVPVLGEFIADSCELSIIAAFAKAGDDMCPQDWLAFYCDGSFGVCIDAGIWHEAIIPLGPMARFYDKQGAVHARVSANFAKEFGVLLAVPLDVPNATGV